MTYLLLGVFIFFLSLSLGRQALGLLRISCQSDEELVFGTGLGLGIISYAVLLLGLLNLLRRPFLWGLLGVLLVLSILTAKGSFQAIRGAASAWKWRLNKTSALILSLSLVTLGASLLGTLTPETGNDSLCYHLHLPKLFLEQGSVSSFPYEVNSLFPFFMEMLYTLALGLVFTHGQPSLTGGMILAKFFHFGTGLLAAGAILIFLRRRVRIHFAWYAALLFLTTPVVINQMAGTYVDVAAACFSTLALLAALRGIEEKKVGWMVLAGIFAGFTLSVKYLGLISVLGIFLLILRPFSQLRNLHPVVRNAGIFLGAAALISGYWYLRAYLEIGNPVYPYFYSVFKSGYAHINYNDIGVSKDVWSFLCLPWTITMHPEKFEGFGVQIGPGYLAFLPVIFLFGLKKIAHWRSFLFFAAFYFACWFWLGQSLRFFIPVLPVLAILMAQGLSLMEERNQLGRGIKVLFVTVFLIHAGLALFHYRGSYKVALGLESGDEYLNRVERTYSTAQYVNSNLPENSKILNCDDPRMFYFRCPILREGVYGDRTGYFKKADSVRGVLKYLMDQGFTHILWAKHANAEARKWTESLRVPYLLEKKEKELATFIEPIYTKKVTTSDGEKMLYRLYQLNSKGH